MAETISKSEIDGALSGEPTGPEGSRAAATVPPGAVGSLKSISRNEIDRDVNIFEGFDLGEFAGEIVTDAIEGSVAPIGAAWNVGKAILSDPTVKILPAEEHQGYIDEAGRLGIKGAAFWGSALVGGKVLGIAAKPLWKAAVAGGAGTGVFEAINKLPEFFHQEIKPVEYLRDVGTAATFGALTGGVIGGAAGGSKIAMKAANKVIDGIPGGSALRSKVVERVRETHAQTWDRLFTSGEEVLRKAGLENLVKQLKIARATGATLGGRLNASHLNDMYGLKDDEMKLVGTLLEKVNFRKPVDAGMKAELKSAHAPRLSDMEFEGIWWRTRNEAKRLRTIGLMMQKAGVQVYDATSDQLHRFVLRDSYLPHRLINADYYRPGGALHDDVVKIFADKYQILDDDARAAVKAFADRIEAENADFLERRTMSLGASHYLMGRTLELPGFETNVSKVLPQYYEHAARRLANHTLFGPIEASEDAVRTAQQGLFPRSEFDALIATPNQAEQLSIQGIIESPVGKGMKKTRPPEVAPSDVEGLMKQRREAQRLESIQQNAIERRYPRAFAQIEALGDINPEVKLAVTRITRRQLGAIEATPYAEKTLSRIARFEVITKLALGAIAQPSQMLSGIVRTRFRGSIGNMFRAFGDDPVALDFALRSGVTLKGIVRASEQSLTVKDTDFLQKVFFTQADLKSRVFGAIQGGAFAEHVASKLTLLRNKFPDATVRPKGIVKEMAKLERKLMELGLDTERIVAKGGWLDNKELALAGQAVSGDVTLWGDALSLPEFFRSPYGKYITQFKSFGFQQSKLVKDHMLKPLAKGDWGPVTRFALTMPLGGELIADLKALFRARQARFGLGDEPDAYTMRVAENIANAAGFGLAYDAFEATRYGMSGSLGFFVGPIGSEAAKGMTAAGELVRGDPEKMMRFGIEAGLPAFTALAAPRALPVIAAATPALSNILLPKRKAP